MQNEPCHAYSAFFGKIRYALNRLSVGRLDFEKREMIMSRIQSLASIVMLLGIASLARADFHDWRINEVFSDASGNVQFIEFHNTLEDGEEFLSGHMLKSNASSFTFPNDLPSDQTLNKFFLVATED